MEFSIRFPQKFCLWDGVTHGPPSDHTMGWMTKHFCLYYWLWRETTLFTKMSRSIFGPTHFTAWWILRALSRKKKWLLCKADGLFPSSAEHETVEFTSTPTYRFIACTWTTLPLLFPFSSLRPTKTDSFHPLLRNNIWCGKSRVPSCSCKQGQLAVCLLDRNLSRQIKRLMAISEYVIINITAKPV